MLNIIPFFNVDAPAVYTQLLQLVLMIALTFLFYSAHEGSWCERYLRNGAGGGVVRSVEGKRDKNTLTRPYTGK
jgi:hypothetical protein